MSSDPKPVYVGQFPAMYHGDVQDFYIDITADLVTGEALSSATATVKDSNGDTVAAVVSSITVDAGRVDFRVTAPAAGGYRLIMVCNIDDSQKITKLADLWVV